MQLNEQTDQLLTREETAKLLSVSLVTLWDWTKKDIIPAYRIGNKIPINGISHFYIPKILLKLFFIQ